MSYFNIVAQTNENTVVTEYKPLPRRSDFFQSEAELEKEFIRLLCERGYTYLPIHSEAELISNLRTQLEELNQYKFTDSEWQYFFTTVIAKPGDTIIEKTKLIQENNIIALKFDEKLTHNIKLIDRENIHNNRLQVINQYEISREQGAVHDNRYDVTILVNGLPLVHIELKRRGVAIREAFNQINRYSRESFWAGSGLFEYVQIFVISNGTNTKYYSNTTRDKSIRNLNSGQPKSKTSNSFEFTSFWADAKNKTIPDLIDFTNTFFAKHTLLNILTRYCIFTSENILLVMRPYQITATERIINRIEIAHNYKKFGSIAAGGYIWHTTGSGKTLTSFKTARIASRLSFIDKVLFVVDRKDLDYQTMKEYDRFEKGAANANESTKELERQLSKSDSKIIITTIQKLAIFIKKNKEHSIYEKQVVIIFDECHRSQFGDMHKSIVKCFKQYYIFGFTGTPIFANNAGTDRQSPIYFTTKQTFGDQLHTYTIVDAINDKNVLPFRVDYLKTMDAEDDINDELVTSIDKKKAYDAPARINQVANYILDHFDQKTYRGDKSYEFNALTNISEVASAVDRSKVEEIKRHQRLNGFNSIFAVSSVSTAKKYYEEFRKIIQAEPTKNLRIAVIYSYAPNEDLESGILDEENSEDTSNLDQSSRDFLESAIADYNQMFQTNYDTSSDKFQNYYKDVSLRMKNKELDLLIVVNMFLTGFDATTLNTLWVDKNLKMHGLIQAFSRTNRILNSVKTFGNIICFRNLQKQVDEAIALFGDEEAGGIVLMHTFKDYYYGYDKDGRHVLGYESMIENLTARFPVSEQIIGEDNQREFITLFGAILRMRNLLVSFDDFKGKEILPERDLQDYLGRYQDLRDEWIRLKESGTDITDDIVFEIELIKQIEINIDYILLLVKKYRESHCEDKEVLVTIDKAIDASPELRSKKKLIEAFIDDVNSVEDILTEWNKYVSEQREKDLQQMIEEERLNPAETRKFLENSFRYGEVKIVGTDISRIMPPMSRFGGGNRAEKKQTIIDKLIKFFEKFFGIGESPRFTE